MTQMTPGQTRIIDPILTNHFRGFRDQTMVAESLFPRAPVAAYGGTIITFGKEAFRRYATRRAPGTNTKRMTFGYEGDKYAITPKALEAPVPRELMRDASQVPGIDLGARAVNVVGRVMARDLEVEAATLALNASAYDANGKIELSGQNRWSGTSGDPLKDVEQACAEIEARTGMRPNRVLLSRTAFAACRHAAKVVERFKYTSAESITTAMLAAIFDVESVVVGRGVQATGANDAFSSIWGDDVVVAYVGPVNSAVEEPSCGYTYTIEGHPLVEAPYWDNSAKSWIYGVADDCVPVVASRDAMFLIKDAGAAPS